MVDRLQLRIRSMTLDDIDQVVMMDRLSFPLPWSARTYQHEVLNNRASTMLVVEQVAAQPAAPPPARRPAWPFQLLAKRAPVADPSPLVAYAGFWHIADEVHISTIAVHPDWRGRKLGELLIWTIAREAIRRGAALVTLEVRVTNTVALNLYRKYGFEVVGVRRGYYRDNGEDAYLMTVTPLDEAYRARLAEQGRELDRLLEVKVSGLALRSQSA